MKNIPIPSKKVTLQKLINSIEQPLEVWDGRPTSSSTQNLPPRRKKITNFKSLTPAPFIKELKEFEEGLANLLKDIKFRNRYNSFQNKLSKDIKEIKNGKEILVKGDKSTNFHKMAPTKYNEFLDKAIQKEYKKAPPTVVKNIQSSHSKIVSKLDIEDRVFRTTESQPFITIKDHKIFFKTTQLVA